MRYRKAKRLALDCEMVDVGTKIRRDTLAKVSIVDEDGKVVYDKYVKPNQEVTDYRTPITGITARTLKENGENYDKVRQEVREIINGCILVGHSLEHDLQVLNLDHPEDDILDTSMIPPYKHDMLNYKTPALKFLAKKYLGITMSAQHNSVVDAQIAMKLSHGPYKKMSS